MDAVERNKALTKRALDERRCEQCSGPLATSPTGGVTCTKITCGCCDEILGICCSRACAEAFAEKGGRAALN
jgi:hypothetical protein